MRPLARDVSYDIHKVFNFITAGIIAPNRPFSKWFHCRRPLGVIIR